MQGNLAPMWALTGLKNEPVKSRDGAANGVVEDEVILPDKVSHQTLERQEVSCFVAVHLKGMRLHRPDTHEA
ncbi:hypothetical protein N7449_011377 [Penicillium cf. viridicatum]|uniref:Uncharacterized protein n=1 Tax=Penicillium cf. viridicatum TaxID=2972119 RepID=A0A9W9IWX6_9EURO|nr:hypothetical protein N7449_011377 [Penicillium cf. viridicatum]